MPQVEEFNIELMRNAEYNRVWRLTDDEGVSLDLTGATHEFDVKASAGAPGAALGSATITAVDVLDGSFNVNLDGSDFAAVPGVQERVRLAFDHIIVQDGVRMPIARGALILLPGVS